MLLLQAQCSFCCSRLLRITIPFRELSFRLLWFTFHALEDHPARPQRDSVIPAHIQALSAADALVITHTAHVHRAAPDTSAAVRASIFIDLNSDDRNPVEESVDGPQRAQEPAEGPIAEDAGQHDDDQDHVFQIPQSPEKAVTERAIDVQIVGLRRKLGAWAAHIETIRGVGYRFRP